MIAYFQALVTYFPRQIADVRGGLLRGRLRRADARLGRAPCACRHQDRPRRRRSLWGLGQCRRQLQTAPIPLILGPGGSPAGTGSPRGKAPMVQTPWQGVSSEEVTHARR